MPETTVPPITAVPIPPSQPPQEPTTGRGHKKKLSCPKCGREYKGRAGEGARKLHEDNCKGTSEEDIFEDKPKAKVVTRPPKKQLWYCTNVLEGGAICNASFYKGTEKCPNCGEEIEW